MTTSGDVGGRQVWGKNGPLCDAPTCEQGQVRGSLDSSCCPGMSPLVWFHLILPSSGWFLCGLERRLGRKMDAVVLGAQLRLGVPGSRAERLPGEVA